jgi:hypothetical protein
MNEEEFKKFYENLFAYGWSAIKYEVIDPKDMMTTDWIDQMCEEIEGGT